MEKRRMKRNINDDPLEDEKHRFNGEQTVGSHVDDTDLNARVLLSISASVHG